MSKRCAPGSAGMPNPGATPPSPYAGRSTKGTADAIRHSPNTRVPARVGASVGWRNVEVKRPRFLSANPSLVV